MATAIEIKEELKTLGIETEENNVPKLNKMLKEAKEKAAGDKTPPAPPKGDGSPADATPENDADEPEISHTVTAEDLERRPEMIEQGINEGDEVSFDTQEEYDEFLTPIETPKKRVNLNKPGVSSAKGFDIIRNGTYYIRTYETEAAAIDFLKKHEVQNMSLSADLRLYYSIVPANTILEVEVVYNRMKVVNNLAVNLTEHIKFSEEENGPKWKELAVDHAHQWPNSYIAVTVRAEAK